MCAFLFSTDDRLNVFLLLLHKVAAPACAKHGRESQDRLCRGECGLGMERGRRCRQQVSDLPALSSSDQVWLHATVSPFKDPSTGWHGPQTWIRSACLWNLRLSYSSLLPLFWDKSTQWDRRPYALAAKMSAPRQGELTLGCSVLAAHKIVTMIGCSTILSSRKLFVVAQRQTTVPN